MPVERTNTIYHDIDRAHFSYEILIRFTAGVDPREIETLKGALGAETLATTALTGIQHLRVQDGTDLDALLRVLNTSALVEMTDLNYQIAPAAVEETFVPDDALLDIQWGMENTGTIPDFGNNNLRQTMQNIAVADADIDATGAWAHATGAGVVVAVIDTGIDLDHPDLDDNLWINTGEIAGNGIDDDGNGYIDDVHGFDFGGDQINVIGDRDSDVSDVDGHGTHVAGIIAAEGDNGIGVTGVAYEADIMVLRVGSDDSDSLSGFAILEAIEYAADNGARISNNSYGPLGAFHRSTIEAAGEVGHLFVYAAGNSAQNQDLINPSSTIYDLDNVIAVAASSLDDTLASFSNFGANTVDLAAPGHFIPSTYLNGGYAFLSGTSMAAPHVAGAAALALSIDPSLTVSQLVDAILGSVDQVAALDGQVTTGGRLNIANLVSGLLPTILPPTLPLIQGTSLDERLTGTNEAEEIDGLSGNDRIDGKGGDDILRGGRGKDQLNGGEGADLMIGGSGDDSYVVDDLGDVIVEERGSGGDGVKASISYTLGENVEKLTLTGTLDLSGTGNELNNRLNGNDASNTLSGLDGKDVLFGNGGEDVLFGGDGNDKLTGGGGADMMHGGLGNDVYTVDHADDQIFEEAEEGADTVITTVSHLLSDNVEILILNRSAGDIDGTGNDLNNTIAGSDGSNLLIGLGGNDRIEGKSGEDTLEGGEGADNLNGGDGADLINGGAGVDVLTGGSGADMFLFMAGASSARDRISDFEAGEDKIVLDGLSVTALINSGRNTLARLDSGDEILFFGVATDELDLDIDFMMT